jgi:hypothetical protein
MAHGGNNLRSRDELVARLVDAMPNRNPVAVEP